MKKSLLYIFVFFLLPLHLYCFEKNNESSASFLLTGENIHLWTDKNGSSKINGFDLSTSFPIKDNFIKQSFTYRHFNSSLPYYSGNADILLFSSNYFQKYWGIKLSAGLSASSKFSFLFNHAYSLGMHSGFTIFSSFPVFFDGEGHNSIFGIEPFTGFFKADFEEGSFYYFLGNFSISSLFFSGSRFFYKNNNLLLVYSKLNFHSDNKDSQYLFGAENIFAGFIYKYNWKINNFEINPAAAYFYGFTNGNGALTSQNQKYFFYPYKYFKFDFTNEIHFSAVVLELIYSKNSLKMNVNTAFMYFPFQKGTYFSQWKYKKNRFFNGSRGNGVGEFNFCSKKGVVILHVSSAYDFNQFFKHLPIKAKIGKTFAIPIDFTQTTESANINKNENTETFINWLLSGISLSFALEI